MQWPPTGIMAGFSEWASIALRSSQGMTQICPMRESASCSHEANVVVYLSVSCLCACLHPRTGRFGHGTVMQPGGPWPPCTDEGKQSA